MITIKLDALMLSDPQVHEALLQFISHLSSHGASRAGAQRRSSMTFEGPSGSKVSIRADAPSFVDGVSRQLADARLDQDALHLKHKRNKRQAPAQGSRSSSPPKRPLKSGEVKSWLESLQARKALFVQRLIEQGSVRFEEAYELLGVPPEQRTLKRLNGILGTIARWSGPNGDSIIVPWESRGGAYHWRAELISED